MSITLDLNSKGELIMFAPHADGSKEIGVHLQNAYALDIIFKVLQAQHVGQAASLTGSPSCPVSHSLEQPKDWLKHQAVVLSVYVDRMEDTCVGEDKAFSVLVIYKKTKFHSGGHSASFFKTQDQAEDYARRLGWTVNEEEEVDGLAG